MKRFKRVLAVALAAVFVLGGAFASFAANETKANENYAFTYDKTQYQIGMDAATAMKTLGDAVSSRDVNNCANGYVNKAYMYGKDKDFEVYVEQDENNKEIVANITLLSSAVATEEGLKVGDSDSKVTEIYADAKKGLGSYTTTKGKTKLYIKMKAGAVSYIAYMIEK